LLNDITHSITVLNLHIYGMLDLVT
jgi:hypothetical protein